MVEDTVLDPATVEDAFVDQPVPVWGSVLASTGSGSKAVEDAIADEGMGGGGALSVGKKGKAATLTSLPPPCS